MLTMKLSGSTTIRAPAFRSRSSITSAAEPESQWGQRSRVSKAAAAIPSTRRSSPSPSKKASTSRVAPCCSVGPPISSSSVSGGISETTPESRPMSVTLPWTSSACAIARATSSVLPLCEV